MRFGVLYPDHLSRWKTLLRIFFLIPVWLVFYVVSLAFEGLALVGWTGAFWRKKYPSWAFRGITGILDYQARAMAYALLLTDRFPSMDREQTLVRLDFEQPQPGQLSRWRVFFWKLLLIIPHYVVLSFLFLALVRRYGPRLVRHPLHGQLPTRHVRLRPGRDALAVPRHRLLPLAQ